MTDELDLLSSLNPVPEVRGNPGPVPGPSPGELLAETGAGSGQPTSTRSHRRNLGRRQRGPSARPGGSRWALGAIGVAAAVAVVVGVVAATGDDSNRRDQVITGIDNPPPAPDAEPLEADEPRLVEEAAPAVGPTDDLVVTDETVPWPDPIVIEVTPETASADRIIEVPAGLMILEIRGSGWDLSANYASVCESYEIIEPSGFSCRRRIWTPLLDDRSFSRPLVVPALSGPATLLVQFNDPSGAGPVAVGTLMPESDGFPTLIGPDDPSTPESRGLVDRVTLEASMTGEGWMPDQPIVLHVCASRPPGSLDTGDCVAVGASPAAVDGGVETTVALPRELVGIAVEGSEFWLVGAQGSGLAAVPFIVLGPRVELGPRPDSLPASVDVAIVDLRAGEQAVIRACGPAATCREPIRRVEVVGSGSGRDTVAVRLDEHADRLQLFVEGSFVADEVWFEGDPSPPGSVATPATLTVEPGSVPGPGTYDFVVRGAGWTVEPPIFVVSCFAVPPVGAAVRESCHMSELTPTAPDDGAFEVTVTYEVGPEGLVIAAGDATRTQSAIATVAVE